MKIRRLDWLAGSSPVPGTRNSSEIMLKPATAQGFAGFYFRDASAGCLSFLAWPSRSSVNCAQKKLGHGDAVTEAKIAPSLWHEE